MGFRPSQIGEFMAFALPRYPKCCMFVPWVFVRCRCTTQRPKYETRTPGISTCQDALPNQLHHIGFRKKTKTVNVPKMHYSVDYLIGYRNYPCFVHSGQPTKLINLAPPTYTFTVCYMYIYIYVN